MVGADGKVAAILGWGTADTEALTGFLAQDKIPDISASYAAALSDPTGASGKAKPAPYNFFYGPSYSDAVRAHADLGRRGLEGQGQARQAEVRSYGRQPSLSERAEGGR